MVTLIHVYWSYGRSLMDGGDDDAAGFLLIPAVFLSGFIWGMTTSTKRLSLETIITANILLTRICV